MSIADDAAEQGETDMSPLLHREIDRYFEFELTEIVLKWEKGGCV
jgi:hypothetical protein